MIRRRRRVRLLPRILFGLAALALPASAAAHVRVAGVDASGYPEIQATVIGSAPSTTAPVLTENGEPVVGLQARNLGRRKAVVLALDRSQSMSGKPLRDAAAAARAFVTLTGSRDSVGVVAFGRRAIPLTGLDSAPADADAALAGVRVDTRSGTALYDAVALAASNLATQPLPGRVLVLLTDGHDVSSVTTLDRAVSAARRAHVVVYPIAVSGAGFDAAPLRRLAQATGGTYHLVGSTGVLAAVYKSIAEELSRTWHVRYTTAGRPGETLRLQASLRALGTARTMLAIPSDLGGSVAAPPPPSRLVPHSLYGVAGTLAIGVAVALLLALAWFVFASSGGARRLRARLEAHVAPPATGRKLRTTGAGSGFARQLFRGTEQAFGNLRHFRRLQRVLERADLPLRASEFLYIQLGFGFLFGLLAAAGRAPALITLVTMAVGASLPRVLVSLRARARLRAFENQLPDLLITIAASLKAGHSFRQGLQTVVEEGHPPASEEFKRVLTETSLGRPMDDALHEMAERVGSKNLDFVITAVTIQRQVGGSLAGLFDMVADAVRQRQAFARKVKGLTAMGRMSAYVLIGLPFFLAAILTVMNNAYMAPLYHSSTGHKLIAVCLVMMTVGSLMLKKMVSFKG